MASTFSDRLGIELIGDGEQSNSWGNTTNNNFGNIFDEAISGFLSIDLGAQSSPYALSFSFCFIYKGGRFWRDAIKFRIHMMSC